MSSSHELTEEERIQEWRMEQFIRMGFNDLQVVRLDAWGVDLHDAEYLMTRGCKPHLAVAILEPLPA